MQIIASLRRKLRPYYNLGTKRLCPCCGWHFRKFLSGGVDVGDDVLCPKCGSMERHRLLWLYLKEKTNFFRYNSKKVLHIAPESIFSKRFKKMAQLNYVSADLHSSRAPTIRVDITAIPCKHNSFDVVLCNHVLEHVPDDHRAMTEIRRVLRPGGFAILQVPLDPKLPETYEDFTIVTPEGRERAFGQHDHVRIYGLDYQDRLKQAGLTVKVDHFCKEFSEAAMLKYGLMNEEIYFCTKAKIND